jgi:UPF0755 protein
MARLSGPLSALMAGVVLLLFAGGLFLYSQVFTGGPKTATEVTFTRGMSVKAMGGELRRQHVIGSATLFRLLIKMSGHGAGIKAGTYAFPANANLLAVVKQIESGKVIRAFVTIPEGKTSAQAVRILMATSDLTGDVDVPPEGSLLPETYMYQRGEQRQAVLDRMLDAGRKTLGDLWKTRAAGLPFKTKEEALIMASVVERETGLPSERPRVAAVFVNRLRKGMRLESDPTVIYGVSHGEPLGRGLLKTELETKTPWNTYLIAGLPVTPIDNPGRASIAAVLNPAPTEDLYFVADGSGGHAFAATYEEHLANVAHWRQIEGQVNQYTTQPDAQVMASMSASTAVNAGATAPNAPVQSATAHPVKAVKLKGRL